MESVTATCATQYYSQGVSPHEVDLLVLVDNSGGMSGWQQHLAEYFPKLIDGLRHPAYGRGPDGKYLIPPNLRIGVVTSDLGAGRFVVPGCEVVGGQQGKLVATRGMNALSDCPVPEGQPWIEYASGKTNIKSASDPITSISEGFRCIGLLGSTGCGFEHQLEALRRALDPALNINVGFLRPDALLFLLILTDEDDCSAKDAELFNPARGGLTDPMGPLTSFRCFEFGVRCDINDRLQTGPRRGCVPAYDHLHRVEDYVAFFKKLKPPGRVLVSALAAPASPVAVAFEEGKYPTLRLSCQSAFGGMAMPAVRIKAFVDAFGPDGQFTSICEVDYGVALANFGKRVSTGNIGCVPAPLLTDKGALACEIGDVPAPGATCARGCLSETACRVEEVRGAGATQARQPIPRCPAALFDSAVRSCGAACPCWRIVRSAICDPNADGTPYRFQIMRDAPAIPAMAEVQCAASRARWGSAGLAALPRCE